MWEDFGLATFEKTEHCHDTRPRVQLVSKTNFLGSQKLLKNEPFKDAP
jgi:hypothetical protein